MATQFQTVVVLPKNVPPFQGFLTQNAFLNAASKYFILCLHLCCLRFSPAWQLVLASQSAYWAQPQELLQHLFTSLHQANPEFSSHNYFQNNPLFSCPIYMFLLHLIYNSVQARIEDDLGTAYQFSFQMKNCICYDYLSFAPPPKCLPYSLKYFHLNIREAHLHAYMFELKNENITVCYKISNFAHQYKHFNSYKIYMWSNDVLPIV